MTNRFFLTCSLASAAFACTVGAFAPSQPYPYKRHPIEDAKSEDAPVRGARAPRLACVRDNAGVDFATAGKAGKGTLRGCIDGGSSIDVYALTAGPNAGGTIFGIRVTAKESVCAELFDQDRKSA